MDTVTPDEVGNWTEIKLKVLRKYARSYTAILKNQPNIKRVGYIDGFAGLGRHLSRSTQELIPGSPRIALEVMPPFDEYHFIDLNSDKTRELDTLIEGRANASVHAGDANRLLPAVFQRFRYTDYARALCLLDPYGLNLHWTVLEAAGKAGSIEVFYSLMMHDMNRNILWHNQARVSAERQEQMTLAWGDESWKTQLYLTVPGLFAEETRKAQNDEVAEIFRQRLMNKAGFQFVPPPLAMRNSSNAILYYLYFATPNKTADKIVTEIFDSYRARR